MSYDINKQEVLKLFDNHIMKYIIKDLEVLDSIISDNAGTGGCAIPQAISTFSALDLIGYLVHPQEIKPVGMSFSELLKNEIYFPGFKEYTCHINFLDSFRDNIRSIMVHRYSLVGYEITKNDTEQLFWNNGNNQTFNASYFTKMTISAIKKIYNDLKNDKFRINKDSKEKSMEKIKQRIEKLKTSQEVNLVPLINLHTPINPP